MQTPFTDNYDMDFLRNNMMGPNAMRITEELTGTLPMAPGLRVLDLGCGTGLSSILLAEKYEAAVVAAELWVDPGENAKRFADLGLDAKITPLRVDATQELPFAQGYFDMIVSVDAYQYFGDNQAMLPKLLPFLKKGGYLAVTVPGFKGDFAPGNIPLELQLYWTPEWHFYSSGWWRALWEKEPGLGISACREMECFKAAWKDWLATSNPYAQSDIAWMEAGGWKYTNLIQITGRKL